MSGEARNEFTQLRKELQHVAVAILKAFKGSLGDVLIKKGDERWLNACLG